MPVITDLKEKLNDLSTFQLISSTLSQTSAIKLRNIRRSFEHNCRFYEEISHVYHVVMVNAAKLKILPRQKKLEKEKVLSVAVTSNLSFYGTLNIDIMKKFLEEGEKGKTDRIIIGSTGVSYMRLMEDKKPFETILFKQDNPTLEETGLFLEKVKEFDKVFLYYPKFVSLLTQTVGVTDITYTQSLTKQEIEEEIYCIFEPELPKIVEFFNTQVRTLLFLRVMLEAELARTATRLMSMSQAEERTELMMKETGTQLNKAIQSFTNAQLLETFSGILKWKH